MMTSVLQAETIADPVAMVLAGFGARRVRLDNAFFKFNLPERGMALLVDCIIRRRRRQIHLRVSLYSPEGGMVHEVDYPLSSLRRDAQGNITFADIWLGAQGSRGVVGPIAWDLVFQSAGPAIDPQVAGRIQPFDLRFLSAPDVLFSGGISVARQGYSFSRELGMVGGYHGRRLSDQWYWISANTFATPGYSLECLLLNSSVFGIPFWRARVGYFHLRTPNGTILLMHPLTGLVRLTGDRHALVIVVRPNAGEQFTIRFSAPETHFQHLGDRVFATLLGTCAIEGLTSADGTAGLEQRESAKPR